MKKENDVVCCLKLLMYLQAHSPDLVSRKELSAFLNISIRSITRYANKLKVLGVASVRGKNGGFYYDGKDLFPMSLSSIDELFALNLSLISDSMIDRINTFNKNGIKLSKDLMFINNKINDEDMKKMVKICEGIHSKTSIKVNYQKNDGTKYECYLSPICFKNYDGLIYLFAYYRDEVHSYVLNKLDFLGYSDHKYEIKRIDLIRVASTPNHEIAKFNDSLTFRIRVKSLAYNRLKRAYKDTIKINYDEPVNVISITTSSYKEEVSLLLSLGSNIEFIDKDNEVYKLYKEEIKKMIQMN